MNVAVCFNRVPPQLVKGEAVDRVSEEGAEHQAHAVAAALEELGHKVCFVALGASLPTFLAELQSVSVDLVFNLCEGFWGESRMEMNVAALLEMLGLPFTGSPSLCLGVTQNKSLTKALLLQNGLPTPKSLTLRGEHVFPRNWNLSWPLIVKPASEDASLGIGPESVVTNEELLRERVRYIHNRYQQAVLVEEYIDGREFNAAVVGDHKPKVLPLSEIRFDPALPWKLVTYAGKWHENSPDYTGTQAICPPQISARDDFLVRDVALRAYKLLGCRDYARVDIRLRDGIPFILEINANPDISPEAGLARSARAGGLDYPQLIDRIIRMALKRKEDCHAA
ncbi:MAG: ATP-grasp domain-containing protein [Deltaproteobacteria bacterium]|nr:ATP-grasp domain-containing protein [Deltaproteobacteria bacterium]